ncbi:ISL3 family transposase [Saccharothrix longispora]|uniref:ISL3 family transposase n=1 Tax=Saccharothrix longispora TaxID=33920 RepID=UPI0028FD5085|nr:ISL3 family transposase [Saccharothrix longispora]MDU0294836.1 ISL3 family transposase [Saccharothrix longispora]
MVVERVERTSSGVRIWACTRVRTARCPSCGVRSGRVHSRYDRKLDDAPVAGRPVVLRLRVRRFFCDDQGCEVGTFAEQVEGLTVGHARRTLSSRTALECIGLALAGRTGARLAAGLGLPTSRSTLLRLVHALPDPPVGAVEVLGVDDFALRRGRRYATVLIDAVTHRRVDVLPDRRAATLTAWLREHPGVRMVCRDGSATYAEAVRQGAPNAIQIGDRWHIWSNLVAAVEKTVTAHSTCWYVGPARRTKAAEERALQRHAAVHGLLDQGVGLLECARRLGVSLNTVKRYARIPSAEDLRRPPPYRRSMVDPYRDHLRARLARQPDVPVTHLLAEIRALGYPGSANLLVRYLNQGRAEPERVPPSPRRLVTWLTSKPKNLPEHHRRHLDDLITSCPPVTKLAQRIREFAAILTRRQGQGLDAWIEAVLADDLPALHRFVHGLRKDHDAVVAGLTLPHSNGPTEGVVNKIKLLKRQTYGRASFALLRKRILLNQ